MAKSGYGKRQAGDEEPDTEPDFAHLGARESDLATFIDHLPDGAAMGHKAIAAAHPRYGQQAVRTSLNHLIDAGHLRWVKEHLTVEDGTMRWVTRTYWSRTPESPAWWAEFVRERHGRDVTHTYRPGLARTAEPEPKPEPTSPTPPEPSAAHRTLAQLRTADRRMALSEGECKQLEPSAAEWLERGATPHDITRALTEGLPPTVTNPGGLARNRLENKMPPKRQAPAKARARVTRAVMICGDCEEPETSVELVNGICTDCYPRAERTGYIPDTFRARPRRAAASGVVDVTERVAELRRAAGLPTPRGDV
ncbi:hypothetical protein ABZ953_19720 [Streptomyces sp. NPDC046465]|uniref:hypothetical protein n=1 Tax=Streptomyces sp. NPDC046465 TaxID=3155810 RepID=UPI0033CEC639